MFFFTFLLFLLMTFWKYRWSWSIRNWVKNIDVQQIKFLLSHVKPFLLLNFESFLWHLFAEFCSVLHFLVLKTNFACRAEVNFCKCKSIERGVEYKSPLNIHLPWKCIQRTMKFSHNTEFCRTFLTLQVLEKIINWSEPWFI